MGRDLLSGVLLGLLWAIVVETTVFVFVHGLGAPPSLGEMEYLAGGRRIVGAWLAYLLGSISSTLILFLVLSLLRVLLKRPWLAALAFVVVFAAPLILASRHPRIEAPMLVVIYTIAAVAVIRSGLVALAAGILTSNVLLRVPVTRDPSSWYAGGSVFVFASVLVIALWGFYTSLAGQRLWKGDAFE